MFGKSSFVFGVLVVVGWITVETLGFILPNKTHQLRSKRNVACYGELGCFDANDYFDPVNRPILFVPSSREDIDTRFGLYTRENPPTEHPEPEFIRAYDAESVKNSHFHPDKPIKFLVHGFLDTGFLKWVNELGNALLEVVDANVIAVDWSGGNGVPYGQATANTWIVGGEIYLLSKFLIDEFGVKIENIHIIGHSLGAHVAGYAGDRFNGAIGRISALDAAEPYFQYLPKHVRLDETDARFIDAIHTDGKTILLLGFGMVEPVGHLDFYPNGGLSQPGCDLDNSIISVIGDGFQEGVRQFVACNHQRAIDLYTESIKSQCPFITHECHDYEYYQKSRCTSCGSDGSKCAKMGFYANEHPDPTGVINRKLYLTTASKKTFCEYHYVITIVMEETDEQKEEHGILEVSLYGDNSQDLSAKLNDDYMTLRKGRRYQFLLSHRSSLGPVKRVDFRWESKFSLDIFHKPRLYVEQIEVEPLDVLPETERVKQSTVNCRDTTGALLAKHTYTFHSSNTCHS